MSKKKVAYENPLMPNARLRQMYRAILRAHLLGQSLPPAQRGLTAGREAALVSTSIDLTARDFVLDAFSTAVTHFIRGTPLKHTLNPKDKLSALYTIKSGSPFRLPMLADPKLRIYAGLGTAASLQSDAALAKKSAKKTNSSSPDSAVALSISISGEVPAEAWRPALAHAAQHDLPIIFLVLPPTKPLRTAKQMDLRAIAHRAGVPAIPVDLADPVALYRVAQESIGHARIGGGPAVIQCVAFPALASRTPAAIAHLEEYILSRNIATRSWMDYEASSFAAQLRSAQTSSSR